MRTILIDGKRYHWKDILQMRRDQRRAARQAQPLLFEVIEDSRPPTQMSADGRYGEPTLFSTLEH